MPLGSVASPGFRTLAMLCSLRSLPSLFHPGPALGHPPFEALFLLQRRTLSQVPSPSMELLPVEQAFSPRDCLVARSTSADLEFSQSSAAFAPLGFFLFEAYRLAQPMRFVTALAPSRAFPA